MLVRLPLAFVTGLALYMIAMVLSVYDGLLSLLLQPIMGSVVTLIALFALVVIGSPLLFKRNWAWWARNWWLSIALAGLGVIAFVTAWIPSLQVAVFDPDLQQTINQPNPALGMGGWLAVVFAVLWCPKIGLFRSKRWI